ncbi:MAG: 50S ribosomal protein L6 [Thermoplasmata archaeon]|nr:MAG: 50S ribosomal protein L6 [Thermoplasmata archaeon]
MAKIDVIDKEVKIPEGVSLKLKDNVLTVKGPKGELKRRFYHSRITFSLEKGVLRVHCDNPNRTEMGLAGTWAAHVRNMCRGVTEGFHYQMKIIFSHFPIKTSGKGSELVVENFLGERHPRKAKILEGVTAKISGDVINLEGIDKEKVGQTAANIEKATVIKNYDTRVFRDGIYLVSRGD